MEFSGPDGKPMALRGMHSYPPRTVSTHNMEADLRHGDIAWVVELRISEAGGKNIPPHLDKQAVLDKYLVVFRDILLGQPPDRGFKHTIELDHGV